MNSLAPTRLAPGGYLQDVPWDIMPVGDYVATEVTPPNGYSMSSDPDKVRQTFHWDGKADVDLVFENDAKVKLELLKLDDSERPLEGAVFNVPERWTDRLRLRKTDALRQDHRHQYHRGPLRLR